MPRDDFVEIHYRRLPDRLERFRQARLAETEEYTVTFLPAASIRKPLVVAGRTILEPGAPVIWFTYPGRWYDIGSFHLADGTHTGFYANILTPVIMSDACWETTDLCLDVWVGADGHVALLDEVDLERAIDAGWLDAGTAAWARRTAGELLAAAAAGAWPPRHVYEWPLDRVVRSG